MGINKSHLFTSLEDPVAADADFLTVGTAARVRLAVLVAKIAFLGALDHPVAAFGRRVVPRAVRPEVPDVLSTGDGSS